MYSELIALADCTLAVNRRLRVEAAALRADANALMMRYRGHWFIHLSGGSDTSPDETARQILRDFLSSGQTLKSFVGPSRGSVCKACGTTIKPGEIEYDVAGETSEIRLDGACHRLFIEESADRPSTAA